MKRKYLLILVPAILLLMVGLYYFYTLFAVQNEVVKEAHNYKSTSITKTPYILETVKKEDSSGVYATFIIKNEDTDSIVFECSDIFRTMDLKTINWAETSYNIIVVSGDVGTILYDFTDGTWAKR
jgi:hypothetical protein